MAHIGVKVDQSTKERWQEYVEESSHGSMSGLIRQAVREEMRRDETDAEIPQALEQRINEVAETQQTLGGQMDQVQDTVQEVVEETGEQYPEEVIELAEDIAEDLDEIHADQWVDGIQHPVKRELDEIRRQRSDNPSIGQIKDALEYLEENLSYVKSAPQGPSDYYRVRGQL
jgi:hypothetical protein